ncbi:MAG: hypothetical protein E3J83_06175 [Candidatus Atribacteria bacterium]|nr:MAG: hypothetical protein E3J83_06175 [Candidatus Atribacteria bacterium]
MIFKEEILSFLNKIDYKSDIEKDKIIYSLEREFLRKFYIDIEELGYTFYIKNYYEIFKSELFQINIYSFYERIFRKLLNDNIIAFDLFEYIIKNIFYIIDQDYCSIGDVQIKRHALLCIIKAFKRINSVKLAKIFKILLNHDEFNAALRIYDEDYRQTKENYYSETLLLPEPIGFEVYYQGPLDPNTYNILRRLKKMNFIDIIERYPRNEISFELKFKGDDYINQKLHEHGFIYDLYKDAQQLAKRFNNMSGKELEEFYKTRINPYFRKKFKKGDLL